MAANNTKPDATPAVIETFFAGQYFDNFDHSRHVVRAEKIDWKPWWPRWISIDRGCISSGGTTKFDPALA